MSNTYSTVQRTWLNNIETWLQQVAEVNPEYARSVVPTLRTQAEVLGIDPNDIQDSGWSDTEECDYETEPLEPVTPTTYERTYNESTEPQSRPTDPGSLDPNFSTDFSTDAPSGPMSAAERATFAKKLAEHLKEKYGLTDAQVSGIMGNLMLESRMHPNVREGMTFGGGPDAVRGMGIAQWTGIPGRGGDFADFARKNGLDINSEAANVAFLDHELEGDFANVIADIKRARTPQEAALIWEREFEKATTPNNDERFKMADNFLAFLNGNEAGFFADLSNG